MMTRVLVSVHFMKFKGNTAFWGVFLSLVWNFEFNDFLYCWLMSIVRIAYTSNLFFFSNLFFDILKQSKERHYQHRVNWFKKLFIRINSTYYSKLITSQKVQRTTGFYCSPPSKRVFKSHCSTGEQSEFFYVEEF